MKHPHICFGISFLILFGIEVMIALFVHDSLIRPYLGDVIVMSVLYCFLRMVLPIHIWKKLHNHRCSWWIVILFGFAVVVEILQGIHIVELLGLSGSAAASTIIGTFFDWGDILCYLSGCTVLCELEFAEFYWFRVSDGQ